jgi:hypothetical protein
MSDDSQSGTEYLSESFGRLVGVLQDKDVLSDEEIEYITEGEWPDED